MTIETQQLGTNVVLNLIGRMDAVNAPEFEEACKAWVGQGASTLIIDMSRLEYVSSMGLRAFILVGKILQEAGGDLRLCAINGLVKQVFKITGLTSIFPIHDSVEQALAGA